MSALKSSPLAPPGAGLPLPELLIARVLFALRCLGGNSASFTARFIEERERIRRLLESCDQPYLAERVLIKRPPGLEDSSRDWSVLMTLDHLRIVHEAFVGVIDALARESMPAGKASTAAVKPDPAVTTDIIPRYDASCDALLTCLAAVTNFKTRTKFAHPWFGPMDAHAWHALAGGHMSIHRVQIERILIGLKKRTETKG
jgi:hypothetical protein